MLQEMQVDMIVFQYVHYKIIKSEEKMNKKVENFFSIKIVKK